MPLLHYNEFGQGRPVLILHGLFGSSRNWQGIARSLSDTCRVITVDCRNHGQSFHAPSMRYEEMADDVLALVKQLDLHDGILMGHSMGGKVAMTLTLSQPNYFSALVSVDIAPVNYRFTFSNLLKAMQTLPLAELSNRQQAEQHMRQTIDDPTLVGFILQNLVKDDSGFAWRINLPAIADNMSSISGFPEALRDRQNDLPALFVGGSLSDYLHERHAADIHHNFPNSEVRLIEGAGHWPHAEQTTEFLECLNSFIHRV